LNREPNNKINLFRLPRWQQYGIALLVVGMVAGLALLTNQGKPPPAWIKHRLIPILGWVYLALVGIVVVRAILRRIKRP